ncbi:hypothetical protein [Aquimarina spongiae]|uniref:Uncharacterized protein n=1 Tax=Aquimarina spongiae TaxID=570521 RepID=A0A1M6JNK8_9FLAO|nr:hypothetical protein [Aquimarina spongiae]SHJ48291.1 hypothetical protein SAMN04488508_109164 [Aquimarina spongiae]
MKIILLKTFILFLVTIFCYGSPGDTLSVKKSQSANSINPKEFVTSFFQFPELDNKFPFNHQVHRYDDLRKEIYEMPDTVNDAKSEAIEGFKEIDSTGKWISSFGTEDIQVLPVGIKHKINEIEYQIGFMKASFTKDYTELLVFAKVILPQTDKDGLPVELFFGANNVKLSHKGGIYEGGDLVLLGDMFIPFGAGNWLLMLKGGFDYESSSVENRTYIKISCEGVEEMQIEGEVQFSRNLVLPLDKNGDLDTRETIPYEGALKETIQVPNRVKGEFTALATAWNDFIIEVNLTPFVIADQTDRFTFSANKAILDLSDLRTENVIFPQQYMDNGWLINKNVWKGIYVESLEVGLPKAFKSRKEAGKKRVSFEAANLLLDSHGVSGLFSVNNLIPLDSGITSETDGWAYSVDKMSIELVSNQLTGAGFEGQLILPISGKETKEIQQDSTQNTKIGLKYKGLISEEEFMMSVTTGKTIDFDLFSAKAELLEDSRIELAVVDEEFKPKAVLNGRMAISASQKKSLADEGEKIEGSNDVVKFKGIEFRGLTLQTETPLISVDYFGYKDKVELAGFPVSISDIELSANDSNAQLDFDLMINLMGESDKGFSSSTRLGIVGKNNNSEGVQNWKYDGITYSAIKLDVNLGAVAFDGELYIRDQDSIYGNGFSGDVEATFGGIGPIRSTAVFGKKEFRYWYVDGAIHGFKIPVVAPFEINGFAGGAFYRMTRGAGTEKVFAPSGLSYIPNDTSGLGVKAMTFGSIADPGTVSIAAGFEIEFNKRGGVNRLGFYGEAQLMDDFDFSNPMGKLQDNLAKIVDYEVINQIEDHKVTKTFFDKATEEYPSNTKISDGAISGYIGIEFDFANDAFHAVTDLYVNIGDVLQGRGTDGRAGWGEIYVDKEDWYLYLGTPKDRIGLKMGIGPISVKVGGYFMTGSKIPGSPPPPAVVAEILGVEASSLDYMRDENALGKGRGFAFGSDLHVDTGDIRFLMFYARLRAGIGFDLMMKNYGEARCSNTGKKVGINGWYTNGQAYAYLQGELGIRVKLFFKKKKVRIFKGGTAVLMQAKLPNPFWMRGYMSGDFDVLGGLVSGRFRFRVTIGKKCDFEDESPIDGIKMITDVSPTKDEQEVDVFTSPQATFALKVNQPIVIPEDDGDKTYKVILEKFTVTNEAQEKIGGTLDWGAGSDRVTFIPEDIFPPNTKLKVTVEVSFQEKIGGVFKPIMENGKKALETEERNFTTGTAPDHIPLHNIQYSYPVVDQKHFYKNEYGKAYIKLKQGQDYLFENEKWKSTVKLTNQQGKTLKTDPSYNNATNELYYDLPNIDTDELYEIVVVSSSKSNTTSNQNQTATEQQNFEDGNTIEIQRNTAQNVLKEGEIERLAYSFQSSNYRTFADKIKDIDIEENNWGKISSNVIFLSSKINPHEGFDLVELKGTKYTENKALVTVESDLKDVYFKEDIDPILYQKFPLGGKYSINRNPEILGFRPKRALPLLSNYVTSLENNTNLTWLTTRFPYRYNLPDAYYQDYISIRDRVINDYANGLLNRNAPELAIMTEDYKLMSFGKYTVKLQYILPGGKLGSSSNYKFKNPLSLRP